MKPKKDQPETHAPRRLAASLIATLMLGSLVPAASAAPLIFSCAAGNDLLRVASDNGLDVKRFDAPLAAVEAAGDGDGVLLLADAYPTQTTVLDAALFQKAAGKHLRLYVEYPSFLPGMEVGAPRGTQWEHAVIASDAFAPALTKLRILAIHGCRFLPVKADTPHIVIGRVAGFDTAVYGWAQESHPILFDLPPQAGAGNVLVATTKLSDFVTGRYAPTDAWQGIWSYGFTWLRPGRELAALKWTASVRPSFGAGAALPADIEAQALRRGIDWYFNGRTTSYSPHMQATLWNCYLWAYRQTGFEWFRQRAKTAIGMTMAAYLCRIQIRSESHPELDGGWFRAFDFKRWEYWASSTDAGWGAWSIESGWTQSWITSVLALRQMKTSLWDLTNRSKIKSHFDKLRPTMVPDETLDEVLVNPVAAGAAK
ncbi:MAG: hypothetical protein NTW21_07350 [Verrucomicrobia bacterium]|nr:hypothetical protein [Verrucomicrobiota bacterium]